MLLRELHLSKVTYENAAVARIGGDDPSILQFLRGEVHAVQDQLRATPDPPVDLREQLRLCRERRAVYLDWAHELEQEFIEARQHDAAAAIEAAHQRWLLARRHLVDATAQVDRLQRQLAAEPIGPLGHHLLSLLIRQTLEGMPRV